MFCEKADNKELDNAHRQVLRFILNDVKASFELLLAKRKKCTIYKRKYLSALNQNTLERPFLMWEIFQWKAISYNLMAKTC